MSLYYKKNFFAAHKKKYDYYSDEDMIDICNNLPPFDYRYRLLDLACGSGIMGEYLYSRFPKLKIIGVDNCYHLLKFSEIDVCQSDACFLPFKNESFNCIIAVAAFHHFDHLDLAVKECSRCLKSKGILLCVEPNKYHPQRLIMMTDPLRNVFYKNGDHAISSRQFKKLLINNKFVNIHIEYMAFKGKKSSFLSQLNDNIADFFIKRNQIGILQFIAPWFKIIAIKR